MPLRPADNSHFVPPRCHTLAVSVIIPTWNEANYLPKAITSARLSGAQEVVVVDGGSTDGTITFAVQWADQFLQTERGRAVQMNFGAAHARGEILCFLHADCALSPRALFQASIYLSRPGIAAACFRQHHLSDDWRFRLLDAGATARVRCFGWVYGDQGVVVRRQLFQQVGGFPELPIFEDVALCRKLQRFGRIIVLPAAIYVSPRRWEGRCFWSVTVSNWWLAGAYALGLAPQRLAGWRLHRALSTRPFQFVNNQHLRDLPA
ncbi:MAG: TIGR04283 family arsenosugar biosynthesis glycosyltransferase [Gemmatales bacterium]|nr:TIGR04283 family arsenosugar biosynthesis glycosyltransferase [Gemmatales bacterium]MCS7158966.1 TIGR04283 family arsenosugar biosynthesis glycosyltransferase [Gemmatales bacterium]MDW8174166.1 TIGR04283 family arsenosugar biosynthesis glycosyltransferase [Gemmatales bacterium]MDW8223566.1 TIGR04283 family arsenosugar biosynthesis glycosyltransferase [Gemmatales bacterium]